VLSLQSCWARPPSLCFLAPLATLFFLSRRAFLFLSSFNVVTEQFEGWTGTCTWVPTNINHKNILPFVFSLVSFSMWRAHLFLYTVKTLPSLPFKWPLMTLTTSPLRTGMDLTSYLVLKSLLKWQLMIFLRMEEGADKWAFLDFLRWLDTAKTNTQHENPYSDGSSS